jgi:hypothetical protein
LDLPHEELFYNLKNSLGNDETIENYENYGRGKNSGRLFKNEKIITFWLFPKNNQELKQIVKKIENEIDMVIWDDPDFRIEVPIEENSLKLAPSLGKWGECWDINIDNIDFLKLKDYDGSFMWDSETLEAPHLLSPEQKKKELMKTGYRGKSTKWKKYMKQFESKKY